MSQEDAILHGDLRWSAVWCPGKERGIAVLRGCILRLGGTVRGEVIRGLGPSLRRGRYLERW